METLAKCFSGENVEIKKVLLNKYFWLLVPVLISLAVKSTVTHLLVQPLDEGADLPPEDDDTYWL